MPQSEKETKSVLVRTPGSPPAGATSRHRIHCQKAPFVQCCAVPQSENDSVLTRASLLRRVRDVEDHSSWRDFHDTYRKLIYSFARKAGLSPEEAEDATQETFARLAQKMPDFAYDPDCGSFKHWLLKVARWRVLEQFRQRCGPLASPAAPAAHANTDDPSMTSTLHKIPDPTSLDLDQVWEEQWAAQLLAAAEAKVKRRVDLQKYQIFDLYVKKEWPPEKVASVFGINVAQVYLAKSRILEMIREEVARLESQMS